LDSNEALFTVLTAINSCGYDLELDASDPLRTQIRAEVAKTINASAEAKESTQTMCQFYTDHQQPDQARTLAQYVSLALNLNAPPELTLKVKEADLPPDASNVSGFVPLIQKYYAAAGLRAVWARHQAAYTALTERYHEPLSKALFDTEVYLKLPSAGYLGKTFTVFLEPMGAPGQANARNYGSDYYVVISPGTGPESGLKMEQIRHTYLHYLLDPMTLKYPLAMQRLKPLLENVKGAPMDESFRTDVSLLTTECLIRAIEARTTWTSKTPEVQKQQLVQQSVEQGFILTPYFYEALAQFEKSPIGLKTAYPDLINGINVGKEQKSAAQVKFASTADQELLHLSRHTQSKLLLTAQQRLASGDVEGAKKLAQQALDEKNEDPGRALFILAQVATLNRDMQGARSYFEQALLVAKEPAVVAWSHIYLGRICDLQEDREAALVQYRAALSAGEALPEAKAAAEHGIAQPYEPPSHPQ
jgi:tetratricopeptide (TPR) repeat protein